MEPFLPCPFCGNPPTESQILFQDQIQHRAYCHVCGFGWSAATMELLASRWNTGVKPVRLDAPSDDR